MKKKFILMVLIVIISTILIKFLVILNNKEEFVEEAVKLTSQCLDGRYCSYGEDSVVIGNNQKEIENNFYDIKFEINEEKITIYINKLWYKQFNVELYENEYVEWIISYIQECVNYKLNNTEKEKLKQKIIDKYINVKNMNFSIQENITIGQLLFGFECDGCELIVTFERRFNEKEDALFSRYNDYISNKKINIWNL